MVVLEELAVSSVPLTGDDRPRPDTETLLELAGLLSVSEAFADNAEYSRKIVCLRAAPQMEYT